MKKFIALLLVVIMTMGIFAGCGGNTMQKLDLSEDVPYEMDENGKVPTDGD